MPIDPSIEDLIFSRKFIRVTVLLALILMTILVLGDLLFVIIFPESPLFLRYQFNVDQEGNWATWYNSTLNLAVGVIALIIAWMVGRRSGNMRVLRTFGWIVIAGIFIYLSMDDTAQIHEHTYGIFSSVTTLIARWWPGVVEFRWYIWIPVLGIPGILLLVLVARSIYPDIRVAGAARWLFVIGIILLLTNPIPEVLEHRLPKPQQDGAPRFSEQLYQSDRQAWTQLQIIDLAQETSEMTAVILIGASFLLVGASINSASRHGTIPGTSDVQQHPPANAAGEWPRSTSAR